MDNIIQIIEKYKNIDPNITIDNAISQEIANNSNQSINCLDLNSLSDSVKKILSENTVKDMESYIKIMKNLRK